MISIVTVSNDIHALAIQREIISRHNIGCTIIESDSIAQRTAVSLRLSGQHAQAIFRCQNGSEVDVTAQKVIWLRRPRAPQHLKWTLEDETAKAIIENDSVGALRGMLSAAFQGKWISPYDALIRGSDKIGQLSAAAKAGWRIPATMVTQSRSELQRFFEQHRQTGIIVKTVVGGEGPFLLARPIDDPMAFEEASYEAAPAIYQERITGTRHIRLLCFGERSLAASIDSSDLDWRPNLNVPIHDWPVPDVVHSMTRKVLDLLGLEMGIVDIKETPSGEYVWLEVNPQGQFLFLEPLTKLRLAEHFADYLVNIACRL